LFKVERFVKIIWKGTRTRSPIEEEARREDFKLRKRKVELLLPFLQGSNRERAKLRLKALNNALNISKEPFNCADNIAAAAAGVNGCGGMSFRVGKSPPGRGRLVRLPMQMTRLPRNTGFGVGQARTITAGGLNTLAGAVNPVVNVSVNPDPAPGAIPVQFCSNMRFTALCPEWTTFRIVGLETTQLMSPNVVGGVIAPAFTPAALEGRVNVMLMVKNLRIEGGGNLLPMEGYTDGRLYDAFIPEIPGLRAYPILEAPNRVNINAAVISSFDPAVANEPQSLTFSISLIAEVLFDTPYGTPITGPYARRDALARRPNADEGMVSFV
jgi:hypothetical protein